MVATGYIYRDSALVAAGPDPFFSWGRKDVEDDGIFDSFSRVGEIAGDDKHIAGADNPFFSGTFFAEGETHRSNGQIRDLLVWMRVTGSRAAFLKFKTSQHGLGAGDKLACEQGIELFYG